jgi:hypothetical protein
VPPPPNQNSVPPPQVCCCHDANDSNHACCPVDSTNPPSDPEIHSRNIPKDELKASKHCRLVPDLELFNSIEDAVYHMKVSFGGHLLQDDSKKQSKGNHCWTYKCNHEDEDAQQCPLTTYIKRHGTKEKPKGFSVWMGQPLKDGIPRDMHDHPVDRFLEIGVPFEVQEIVDGMISVNDEVKPNEVLSKIKNFLVDDLPSDHALKSTATVDHLWEELQEKVTNYLKYKRKKNRGDYTARTVQDLVEVCEKHSLEIPVTYRPRSDYKNAVELAEALGIDDVDKMILIHLGSKHMLEELLTHVEEENKSLSEKEMRELVKKAKAQVRVAIIACSPFLLFRLMQLANLPTGLRSIYRDGTHGTLLDGSKLVTHLVSGDVRLRKTQNKVTSKNAAAFYLITPEEYKHTTMASDIWAKSVCNSLFGADLELDWAISDMAQGFLTGVTSIWKKLSSILNCNFHVQQKIGPGSNSELKKKCRTAHQKQNAPRNWKNVQNSKSEALFNCSTSLFIQDLDDEGPHQEKKAATYLRDYYLTALTRNWYYMAAGKFYLDSPYQNNSLFTLTFFVCYFCICMHIITGIPGIYPCSNVCERYQLSLKGTKDVDGVLRLNQSKLSFIKKTAPDILKWERVRSSTFIPGSINFPDRPGRFALAISRCMKKGVDLIKVQEKEDLCWMGNRAHFVGKPLMPDGSTIRIQRYYKAVKGEAGYFLKANDNQPGDTANHMLNFTNGICVVRKKKLPDGQEIECGDCPDCIKNLGFDCPVATMVREEQGRYGQLELVDFMLSQAGPSERRYGPENAQNLRGLGKGRKSKRQKNPGKSVNDSKQFWKSYQEKSDGQFETLCEDFGIIKREPMTKTKKRQGGKRGMSPSKLLEQILLFEKCPTCYRGLPHAWRCEVKEQCISTCDSSGQRPSKKVVAI